MEIVKHTKFIWQYLNVFEDGICDYIRDECMMYLQNDPLIPTRPQTFSVKNDSYNLTQVTRVHPNLDARKKLYQVDQKIHEIYSKIQNHYINNNPLFQYSVKAAWVIGFNSEYQFRHYNHNDEYKWHCDLDPDKRFILSGLLYLNDNFKGGGTRFLMDKLTVQPEKNSMLMFPCGPYFIHRSVPIKDGEKSVIWACFDRISQSRNG
jgi:hypothetical protein